MAAVLNVIYIYRTMNNKSQIQISLSKLHKFFFLLVHHTNEVTYIRQFQHTTVYAIVTWSY